MSAATATYTLGEDEALRCRDCGKMLRETNNDDAVITCEPDGFTVDIRCLKCQDIFEDGP